jgi:hypothetical protein
MEDLLSKFIEILEESVITKYCNCLYNRSAITLIKVNENCIDRLMAVTLVKISLNTLKNGSTDENIYKSLTTLKIISTLLEKFETDYKFIKTILLKLSELHEEINRLRSGRKKINTNRVLENIVKQIKFKIHHLNTNDEILELARSLPS